jgi:hypothetical protein
VAGTDDAALVPAGVLPRIAVGTDLLFAALTKTAGVSIHSLRGTIGQVFRGLGGSLLAAILTGGLIHRLGAAFHVDRLIPLRWAPCRFSRRPG